MSLLLLTGCASGSSFLSEVVGGTAARIWGGAEDVTINAPLNPSILYLRVEVEGRPAALLVRSFVEQHPAGEVEVWYTALREVIKTRHGRIVATAGLETDWRVVRFDPHPPAWPSMGGKPVSFQRTRDQMPGYRFAVSESVELRPWPGTPPHGIPPLLAGWPAGSLRWYRESVVAPVGGSLPPSWFALGEVDGRAMVVYSEQCLSPELCLRMMRWPVRGQAG